jgi:hypothetical protein
MDGLSRCSGDALPYVQEQLWRIGETAVLGSNPVISPAYSGLPALSVGLPSGTSLYAVL